MYKYDTLLLKTLPSIHTHLVCEVGASCTEEGKRVVGTEGRARLLELPEGVGPSAEHGQGHRVLVEGALATSSHLVLEKKQCMLQSTTDMSQQHYTCTSSTDMTLKVLDNEFQKHKLAH